MEFIYNDGGRAAAGFKGSAGDCVTRSIAIAAGKPYQEVYDALFKGIREFSIGRSPNPNNPHFRSFRPYA